MRELNASEIDSISGAGYVNFTFGPIEIHTSFDDIEAGYNWAVEQTTNFFMWWDPQALLSTDC